MGQKQLAITFHKFHTPVIHIQLKWFDINLKNVLALDDIMMLCLLVTTSGVDEGRHRGHNPLAVTKEGRSP